ncbi:MAG: DUF2752 domain-containing protein [Micrococcales bacterium]|nr:DUF2752 domain-containing protein [Micrococcales bacterium]
MTVQALAEPGLGARLRVPLLVAGAAGLGAVALLARDPHVPGSWGVCPSVALAGVYCPSCGVMRGTADLLHGDLAGAWAMNPLWVVMVPVLVLAWGLWLVRRWQGRPVPAVPRAVWWVGLGGLVLFGVARNLPWFEGLAPP